MQSFNQHNFVGDLLEVDQFGHGMIEDIHRTDPLSSFPFTFRCLPEQPQEHQLF